MDKEGEESSADSAVDIKEITPLALTSLSPRTPRSPVSFSSSGDAGPLADPEDDRPQHGIVKKRINDVSNFNHKICIIVVNLILCAS